MNYSPTINAEAVAAKIQSLQTPRGSFFAASVNEHPRLIEALLFIQWYSHQLGGVDALRDELLQNSALGNKAMMKAGTPKSGVWTLDEILPIWLELKRDNYAFRYARDGFWDWLDATILETVSVAELKKYHGPQLRAGLEKYNYRYLHAGMLAHAQAALSPFLISLCTQDDGAAFPTYFVGLIPALCAAMDRHAERIEKQIGQTAIKDKVFERLEFAQSERFPSSILGDARIGKTTSVSTWCNMRPGCRRLITIPETNTGWDFYAAHADALGISYTLQTTERALKRAVEFVLMHTNLFLVYDEFHYALPVRVTKRSQPHRLNWIRSRVIDRGLGCAFFATRQTFDSTMDKFVKETKYQMEQFIGRIAAPLVLVSKLEPADVLNIARSKFPDVDPDVLEEIAGRCIEHEEAQTKLSQAAGAALRNLAPVVSYARFLAKKAGTAITLDHVDAAWLEMVVGEAAAPSRLVREAPARKPRTGRAPRQTTPANVQPLPVERGNDLAPVGTALVAG
jgi:hypothetical protein